MLEKIFTTQGRLNRLPYLKYFLGLLLVSILLNAVLTFVFTILTGSAEGTLFNIISVILAVPVSVASIMCAIRRLHDLNRSGWFVILALIPFVNVLFEIYLLCFRGTQGVNKYGADPLRF